ncbi:unnamed protein product [Victoria cruziana]
MCQRLDRRDLAVGWFIGDGSCQIFSFRKSKKITKARMETQLTGSLLEGRAWKGLPVVGYRRYISLPRAAFSVTLQSELSPARYWKPCPVSWKDLLCI